QLLIWHFQQLKEITLPTGSCISQMIQTVLLFIPPLGILMKTLLALNKGNVLILSSSRFFFVLFDACLVFLIFKTISDNTHLDRTSRYNHGLRKWRLWCCRRSWMYEEFRPM